MYFFVCDMELIDKAGCVFGSEAFKGVWRMVMRGVHLFPVGMYV